MKKLVEVGTCQSEDLIEDIFGSVTEFAQVVEQLGDNFTFNEYTVTYNDEVDIHTFWV